MANILSTAPTKHSSKIRTNGKRYDFLLPVRHTYRPREYAHYLNHLIKEMRNWSHADRHAKGGFSLLQLRYFKTFFPRQGKLTRYKDIIENLATKVSNKNC